MAKNLRRGVASFIINIQNIRWVYSKLRHSPGNQCKFLINDIYVLPISRSTCNLVLNQMIEMHMHCTEVVGLLYGRVYENMVKVYSANARSIKGLRRGVHCEEIDEDGSRRSVWHLVPHSRICKSAS